MKAYQNISHRQFDKDIDQDSIDFKYKIVLNCFKSYDYSHIDSLSKINNIIKKPKALVLEILTNQPSEWLEKTFSRQQSKKEVEQLAEYYKYYKMFPTLVNSYHFNFMNNYWIKVKTLYYRRIKKILQISEEENQETIQRNMTNTNSNNSINNFKTFYLREHIISSLNGTHQDNRTIEKILDFMIKRQDSNIKTVKDSDKYSKIGKEKTSIERNKHKSSNPSTNHLKSTPSQIISNFSYKSNIFQKKKKKNTKSYSNQNLFQSQNKRSKSKKLISTNSCANIIMENQLNYKRRQINGKKADKQQKVVKVQKSKQNQIRNHRKRKSNQKSVEVVRKSQSNSKKTIFLQTNVKAAINKTKNKIKMQKNQILKKIVESRQSYIKSIDSTCGQVGLKSYKR